MHANSLFRAPTEVGLRDMRLEAGSVGTVHPGLRDFGMILQATFGVFSRHKSNAPAVQLRGGLRFSFKATLP